MPSEQAYRIPTWILLLFLLTSVLTVVFVVMSLKNRAKKAWPW